jgi:N-acetylglutamate synthase/N-acetylornithine aminotransferase
VGGAEGRKREGMQDTVAMMEMTRTIRGMEPRKGLISCASCVSSAPFTEIRRGCQALTAPPNGFARLARAVAATRPRSVNHISEYRVGAARTKGCARPVMICPNMTTPKVPPEARVPAYRTQLPTRSRPEAHRILSLGLR